MIKTENMTDEGNRIYRRSWLKAVIFDGVEPNPKDKNVMAGLKVFKGENYDMMITVGGGSSHGCGKRNRDYGNSPRKYL